MKFGLKWKFILFAVFLHKSHIWEKSGSWDMGQNALNQSDYRIFKTNKSLEQNDEKAWFLHVDTDTWKVEVDWKILRWALSKMGVATLFLGL